MSYACLNAAESNSLQKEEAFLRATRNKACRMYNKLLGQDPITEHLGLYCFSRCSNYCIIVVVGHGGTVADCAL